MPGALDGIRILDASQLKAGPYCTKILADFGADVVKLEPPAGDRGRSLEPRFDQADVADEAERSALFAYLHANKRSVVADLETAEGRSLAGRLAAAADVVVQSDGELDRHGLGYEALSEAHPELVMLSITAWGEGSAYADWKTTDLITWAASGALHGGGLPGRQPVKIGTSLTHFATGTLGAVAVTGAVLAAEASGEGEQIDLSLMDGITQLLGHWDLNSTSFRGEPMPRMHRPQGGPLPCKDGWIGINFYGGSPHHWTNFVMMTERFDLLDDERFSQPQARLAHWDELGEELRGWLATQTRAEIFQKALDAQIPFAFVGTAPQMLDYEQHAARGYLVDFPTAGGALPMPGAPVRLSEGGWELRRPAPRLGEHADEVAAEWLAPRANGARA